MVNTKEAPLVLSARLSNATRLGLVLVDVLAVLVSASTSGYLGPADEPCGAERFIHMTYVATTQIVVIIDYVKLTWSKS